MSISCVICNGDISFWSRGTLQDNTDICGDCKSEMNKIYSGFSSNCNEFSLYQVRTLLKKEAGFREFMAHLFKVNPSLSDYSETALRKIYRTIYEDELIHGIFAKHYKRGYGTFVATDKRLIFIDAGDYLSFAFKETIPLENVTSIDFLPSDNTIVIITPQKDIKLEPENQEQGAAFCEAVSHLMANQGETVPQEQSVTTILDLIERLGTLKQNGILTEQEFSQEKIKLFNKL